MRSRPSSSSSLSSGLRDRRRPPAAAVAVLLALHAVFSLAPALGSISSDFANYYVPARAVADGRPLLAIYERDVFDAEMRRAGLAGLGSFVPQPPPNALLLLPLARLDPIAAKAVWTLLLVAAYAGAFLVLRRALEADAAGLALAFLLPSAALANAFAYGQPYPLLLLALCASLAAAMRGRWFRSGLLVAPVLLLKPYALPFVAAFVLARRWRALAGLAAGLALGTAVSVAALGPEVHVAYLRRILPASLEGRIQDPYSSIWQSGPSLARRLFEAEPDLNPAPVYDRPALARGLARGLPVFLGALTALAAAAIPGPTRQWGILACGALAASPLTATYHFVLLVLPIAIWMRERPPGAGRLRTAAVWVLFVFATSPLPHFFARVSAGGLAPLAWPRFLATLVLLGLLAGRAVSVPRAAVALAAGGVAFATGALSWSAAPDWERLPAGGYLVAHPVECAGTYGWLGIEGGAYVVRGRDGTRLPALAPAFPRCEGGRLVVATVPAGRVSPSGEWTLAEAWRSGSWDIVAVSRGGATVTVTSDPANEREPAWSEDGRSVLFASDRGRGLGSTAAYRVPFTPP